MNYFIEYKYLTDLVLDEVIEIKHSAKFIDRILISTQPYENHQELQNDICHLRNILIIKFEISHYFDHCQAHEIKDFFQLDEEPAKDNIIEKNHTEEDILIYLKRETALKKAQEIINYLIQLMFFNDREAVLYFNLKTNLPERDVSILVEKMVGFSFKCVNKKLEIKKNIQVKNALKSINWDNPYYSMLYSIMKNKEMDNISKYVILYSLLIEKFEKQKAVDNKIEEFSSYKRTEIRKDKPDERVTKITWLRNEIGHTSQKDFDLTKLQKEIDEHLNPLFEILKKALIKYVFDK
jgi:hypothetical protein